MKNVFDSWQQGTSTIRETLVKTEHRQTHRTRLTYQLHPYSACMVCISDARTHSYCILCYSWFRVLHACGGTIEPVGRCPTESSTLWPGGVPVVPLTTTGSTSSGSRLICRWILNVFERTQGPLMLCCSGHSCSSSVNSTHLASAIPLSKTVFYQK